MRDRVAVGLQMRQSEARLNRNCTPAAKGGGPFPKKMPAAFKADLYARPGCYVESP